MLKKVKEHEVDGTKREVHDGQKRKNIISQLPRRSSFLESVFILY